MLIRTGLALCALSVACSGEARAASSYDSCTGFIDNLPAIITTQGTWCLRANVSTAAGTGRAIDVRANNVTIDCHDFKVGGLAAGITTNRYGIVSENRQSTTVRDCGLRGFHTGIIVLGGGGHVIEDNRVESSRSRGITLALSQASAVRRNLVLQTGGRPNQSFPAGIMLDGGAGCVATGNVVSEVSGPADETVFPFGINSTCDSADISDNQVSKLQQSADGEAYGILANGVGYATRVSGNFLHAALANTPGNAILGPAAEVVCTENTVANFAGGIACGTSSRNVTMQSAQ